MKTKVQLLFHIVWSLLVLGSATNAYTIESENEIPEAETCNQFLTKIDDGFQTRAYSLKNSSDEWMTATEVANACGTTLPITIGFERFMAKFPTTIKYLLELVPEETVNETYRVNALASWGDLSDFVTVECDYEGNAYFGVPSALVNSGQFEPQSVSSAIWRSTQQGELEHQFELRLSHDAGSTSPVVGEGLLISVAFCRFRPEKTKPDQKLWLARDYLFDVKFKAEIFHWWGKLHPEMWSEFILLAVIALPKLLLVLWFLLRCRMFKDHVMSQQRLFLIIAFFSFASSVAFMIFLIDANNKGYNTCCPTPTSTAVFMGFKVMTNMAFDLLVLATAKGWGVVMPRLNTRDQNKIGLFFLLTLIVYVLSRILRPSIEMAWLLVLNETSIWIWIFICLRYTKKDLGDSGRVDRHAKLEMYNALHRLLLISLTLWCVIVTVEIWVVVWVYNSQGRIVIFDIPPTLAWDISLLVLMAGFGYIWRPSPATAQFSYSFARQEEEGLDARDPVSEFGLETT